MWSRRCLSIPGSRKWPWSATGWVRRAAPAAFVVAADPAPTLAELRDHLAALGMTEWYWPSRLELVAALPRNALGKVRKDALARELDIHAAAAPVMDGQIPG
ncbi:hypothetical protein [Kibdelosporangium philippinense]|uniref:hypothetical protein n=1 Tax=Kibdelosporangium philippinense TaxID=211113 RepID=UPI0036212003